jgi:uncharacterized protein YkwD
MRKLLSSCFALACLVAGLSGCGRNEEAPQAPNTALMGAGPVQCGVRAEEALARINAARAAGRRCGSRYMPAAAPLEWDQRLYTAAFGHSSDMAQRNYFDHRSPTGTTVGERVDAARYKWRGVGENIAGGNTSIADAVQARLDSAEHCENLMDAKFGDVAVACVAQPGTQWGTYWTMVLARK